MFDRLMNLTALFTLDSSKNENCCWVAEHFQHGLSQYREIKRWVLCRAVSESDLMGQGRFTASGCTANDVEREL